MVVATQGVLAQRAAEFQLLCDTIFRDPDGLLTVIHRDRRPLESDDLDEHAYNRPPYKNRGTALAWWQYEQCNINMGIYLIAQAHRAACGEPDAIAAGRTMMNLLFEIYFEYSRKIESGMFGKPILGDGGMTTYDTADEMNHDQVYPILLGLSEFHPFAEPGDQRRIEQIVVEIADYFRRNQYRMQTRGKMATQPNHAVHGNKPMLFLLLAHRFAPEAGFYKEYLRWFDFANADPGVNATCMTYLQWLTATGQANGDDEIYAQGVWSGYIDVIGRIASMDPVRRPTLATRLRQWWEETEPFLRDDGRIWWSMMVRPQTKQWRVMEPGEIERGPFSCWWGAPILFSAQWAATVPVSVLEHNPHMSDVLVPRMLKLLEQVDEHRLAWCWPQDDSVEVPANLRPGLISLHPPVMWLDAYWRGRSQGWIDPEM